MRARDVLSLSGLSATLPPLLGSTFVIAMSFANKVNTLRRFFSIPDAQELLSAVADMNAAMGIIANGALPAQVDTLVAATGVCATAVPTAAEATIVTASPACAGIKRRAEAPSPAPSSTPLSTPLDKKQKTLFNAMPSASKTSISAAELRKQRELALQGESYTPKYSDARTFESERGESSRAAAPVRVYNCSRCSRTFGRPASLRMHEVMSHAPRTKPKVFEPPPPRPPPPPPHVSVPLAVAADGRVSVGITIAGRPIDQLRAEAAAAAARGEERKKAQVAEWKRRERLREAEVEADSVERRGGSGKQQSYTPKEKVGAVEVCNSIYKNETIINKGAGWRDKTINPKYWGIPFTNVVKWRKPDEHRRLLRAAARAHAGTLVRIDKESRKKGKYAAMERELFEIFKARRARGRKVSARWLTHTARHILRQSNPQAAASFKGGKDWRRRYRSRWGISIRKKTNGKNTTWEETKPVLQRYFRALRRRVTLSEAELALYATDGSTAPAAATATVPAERRKYGRYLPWQRANVDQIPLPFVNDMDTTYEITGADRVAINQLGPAMSKRQATGQTCIRAEVPPPPVGADAAALKRYKDNLMEQPPPTIIMRGKGNVFQAELDAYPEGLVVLWQPKAWVDRPTACDWAKKSWKKMVEADVAAGVADESTRYLLFEDNLDAQCKDRNPAYTDYLEKECRTDDHKVPPGKTDQVQPIDRGEGRQIKIYMGQEEDDWLEDDNNLQKWENNELTASDRRVLIATWFYKASIRAGKSAAARKYFEHAGALMTADGSDDHLIKLEGVPKGETFTFMDTATTTTSPAADDPTAIEPEPEDVAPPRDAAEGDDGGNLWNLDEDDDEDDDDVPPAPCEPPAGFAFTASPPSVAALAFSKTASEAADSLIGSSILFHWPVIGWHQGSLQRRNIDGRIKRGGEQCNFYIYYEVDDDEVPTALRFSDYGGEDEGAWLLLESAPAAEEAAAAEA